MPKNPEPFAARLKRLRSEAGLSAYALAAKSGVSKQALSRLEQGAVPSWPTVVKLADALGVSVESFR